MTTLNLTLNDDADDARDWDDSSNFSYQSTVHTNWASTTASARGNGAYRYESVTIPAGSTIDTAVWKPYVFNTIGDDPNGDIFCEDVDDSANYTDTADVTSRATTTASVSWVDTAIGTGYTDSPDISAVVQEVIDRVGWASGQAISVIFKGKNTTPATKFNIYDRINGTGTAAKLDITYTGPSSVVQAVDSYRRRRPV